MRGLHGRHKPPQRAAEAVVRGLVDSLTGEPAARVASTTGRGSRTYSGGELNVQSFLRPPTGPNSEADLAMAPVQVNARSALNRGRGRPTTGAF